MIPPAISPHLRSRSKRTPLLLLLAPLLLAGTSFSQLSLPPLPSPQPAVFGIASTGSLSPGDYSFYTFPPSPAGADYSIVLNVFSGTSDIFASLIPPSETSKTSNLTQPTIYTAAFQSLSMLGQGRSLRIHHTQTPSSPSSLVVGVRSSSQTRLLFSVAATVTTSTLMQLGFYYSSSLTVPLWSYFRLYVASPPGLLCIRMQQQPPQPFGLRLVYAQDVPVNPSWQLSQLSGGDTGSYELQVRPTVTDFTTLYIGVQALLVFQGIRTYTFNLGVFSCNPNDATPLPPRPPISPLLPSGLHYISLSLGASPLAAHVSAGVVALFTFKALPHQMSGIFRISVIEDNPDVSNLQYSNLRVVVRAGAPPSLATFDVASPDIVGTFKSPTHTLTLAHTSDNVWVGVFGLSQRSKSHEFHVQVILQPTAAPVPVIVPLQNNFKYAALSLFLCVFDAIATSFTPSLFLIPRPPQILQHAVQHRSIRLLFRTSAKSRQRLAHRCQGARGCHRHLPQRFRYVSKPQR
jgi:hypothetical protein